ncbi:HK97 family phage prohead protease [Bacillus sp. DX4.1]|uniref:HK97 family phage prohead protease n=1 Tax=Bacillus sp. DX4.1 TaxID=3055867 RepID=UPI0025A06DBF|nr:HK97 family phage prohead protease [Bacillus sp. DX4.1]MDM5189362.1 HK97 family phage prohead protease [Bacillus sp. DX4.1]
MNKMEKRELQSSTIEIRESENGNKVISGYAIKWEMKSHTLGYWRRFKEQFKNGAFTESLTNDNQFALWNHDVNTPLGSTESNTLRLFEDNIGLRFEFDVGEGPWDQQAHETIKRGIVKGVSFGFQMQKEEWDESDRDNIVRTVTKAKLIEISPTPFPAYPDSQVSARSNDPYKDYVEEREQVTLRKKLILKTYL